MIGESAWLNALPPFLLAAVVCIVAVPLSIRLAPRIGAVAHINSTASSTAGGTRAAISS